MKEFNIYIGQNNETKQEIDTTLLKQRLKQRYPEFNGYTILKGNGIFNGFKEYDENTIILKICTNNLNFVYIEEMCHYFKEIFNQECVFYTEHTIKGRII